MNYTAVKARILYKDEQSVIIWKIGLTLDFGIMSLIPLLRVLPHYNKTPCWWTLTPYLKIKIEKSNTPTFFKNNA